MGFLLLVVVDSNEVVVSQAVNGTAMLDLGLWVFFTAASTCSHV